MVGTDIFLIGAVFFLAVMSLILQSWVRTHGNALKSLEARVQSVEDHNTMLVEDLNELRSMLSRSGNEEKRRNREIELEATYLSADDGVVYLGPLNGTHDSDEEV